MGHDFLNLYILDDNQNFVDIMDQSNMHWYLKEKGLPAYLGVKKYNTLGVNPAKFDAALVEVNNHKSDHYFKFIYRKPPENLIGKNLRIVGYSSSHRNPENPWDNTNKIS